MAGFFPFLWKNNEQYSIVCESSLSIHPQRDALAVSLSWLLWVMLQQQESEDMFLWVTCFHFLWIHTQKWDCRIMRQVYFNFFEESPYSAPWWLNPFKNLSTACQGFWENFFLFFFPIYIFETGVLSIKDVPSFPDLKIAQSFQILVLNSVNCPFPHYYSSCEIQ